jgi:hypothetical protein
MRYERPAILRREALSGLLEISRSDVDVLESDVDIKANIVPVTWRRASYASPAVIRREPIAGLLDIVRSDPV